MIKEEWGVIECYSRYEVSTLGRVRNKETKKVLKQSYTNYTTCPYLRVSVAEEKGVFKNENVHRIVAKTFIPNPEGKKTVNHVDGVKENNCVDNLEWCTYRENAVHATEEGLFVIPKGEKNGMSKLKKNDIYASDCQDLGREEII
ncbi:hypothetical protein GOV11_03500 [Candidatus Woesearchaeota archaeon]|nr:hypothetical protein [Candidatus Woesearchaeota archaeon]